MNIDIEIGAEVTLSKQTRWQDAGCNPIGVVGKVVSGNEMDEGRWVTVLWPSGITNTYLAKDDDLIVVVRLV